MWVSAPLKAKPTETIADALDGNYNRSRDGTCLMRTIVDIVSIRTDDINLFSMMYPGAVFINLSNTDGLFQDYMVTIRAEEAIDHDCYYNFLVDKLLAMASSMFRSRCERDAIFKERMMSRVAATIVGTDGKQKQALKKRK